MKEIRKAALCVLQSRSALLVIEMVEGQSEMGDVGRGVSFGLLMQECWSREIEEAIEKAKRRVPVRGRGGHGKWRRRGYWTPVGFAWNKRRNRNRWKRGAQNRFSKYDLVK